MQPLIDIPYIAGLVQSMVRQALDAFAAKDVKLPSRALASDDAVDNLRTGFFRETISFMQRELTHVPQPLNLLSIIRNLERIADHSTNLAEDVLFYVKGVMCDTSPSRSDVDCGSREGSPHVGPLCFH